MNVVLDPTCEWHNPLFPHAPVDSVCPPCVFYHVPVPRVSGFLGFLAFLHRCSAIFCYLKQGMEVQIIGFRVVADPLALSPSLSGYSHGHIADQLAVLIQGHRILHYDCLCMRLLRSCRHWGRKRSRRILRWWWCWCCWMPLLLLLLLGRQRQSHIRHGNGGHILTKRTLDWVSPICVHEHGTTTPTIDMRHRRRRRRRRLHSQIHGVTTGALYASGTSHVHQQSPTSATNQLRHRLCAMRRHGSHRAAQRTSHITGTRWIHQQSMTTATYQLSLLLRSLHRLLLIRHHHHHHHHHTTKALKSPYFPFPRLSISEQSQDLSLSTNSVFFFSPLSLSSARIPPQVYCSINPFISYNPTTTHWSSLSLQTDATLRRAKFDARRAENCAAIEAPRSASVFFVRSCGSRHGEATLVVSSFYMALRKPLFPHAPPTTPKGALKRALKPKKIGELESPHFSEGHIQGPKEIDEICVSLTSQLINHCGTLPNPKRF